MMASESGRTGAWMVARSRLHFFLGPVRYFVFFRAPVSMSKVKGT
jgi:hypothetical protein